MGTDPDATSLEREVAALRTEVAELELELASYATDRKTVAKGLAGGVLAVLAGAAGAAAVIASMTAAGAWFSGCVSHVWDGPHHGPVTGP